MNKQSSGTIALPDSRPTQHLGVRVGVPPQHRRIRLVVHLKKDAIDKSLRVERFATEHGLKVEERKVWEGKIVLKGTVGAAEKAFKVKLVRFKFHGFVYRTHLGAVHVPRNLAAVVKSVSGLNTLSLVKKKVAQQAKAAFKFSISSHVLPGTGPRFQPGVEHVGTPRRNKRIQITVFVRRKPQSVAHRFVTSHGYLLPKDRVYLNRIQLGRVDGARRRDLNRVKAFAQQHQLKVMEINPAQRKIVLEGRIGELERAFGIKLKTYNLHGHVFRANATPVLVPPQLSKIVTGVFGFDTQPIAKPHFQSLSSSAFKPTKVAQLYQFPTASRGKGQCIGLIELGGGYRQADLKAFFKGEGISPAPQVVSVGIDGGRNAPTGNPNGPDAEVCLDIEVAGAVAPRARIAVYFAPNTSRGFIDAITAAVHDRTNRPAIISISWGSAEKFWQGQARRAMNQAFQDAAALGVTVLSASGDSGSSDGVNDGKNHVDFPASSPYVMGCGGTYVRASGNKISLENAWHGSGGGFSALFPAPSWQKGILPHRKWRGVPDVSGNAAPSSGYRIRVDGNNTVVGGTSAVGPLWAGLLARVNGALSASEGKSVRVGYMNALLYSRLAGDGSLRDVTVGNNGAFKAAKGWDPVTGWGSFNGATLLSNLGGKSTGGGKPGKGRGA